MFHLAAAQLATDSYAVDDRKAENLSGRAAGKMRGMIFSCKTFEDCS